MHKIIFGAMCLAGLASAALSDGYNGSVKLTWSKQLDLSAADVTEVPGDPYVWDIYRRITPTLTPLGFANGVPNKLVFRFGPDLTYVVSFPSWYSEDPILPGIRASFDGNWQLLDTEVLDFGIGWARNWDRIAIAGRENEICYTIADTGMELSKGQQYWPFGDLHLLCLSRTGELFHDTINPAKSFYHDVAVGDLNGDGLDDIVAANMGSKSSRITNLNVFLQNPDGTFSHQPALDRKIAGVSKPWTSAVAVANLDSDPEPEIVHGYYVTKFSGRDAPWFHIIDFSGPQMEGFGEATLSQLAGNPSIDANRRAQMVLRQLGYPIGAIDGIIGAKTMAGLRAASADMGLDHGTDASRDEMIKAFLEAFAATDSPLAVDIGKAKVRVLDTGLRSGDAASGGIDNLYPADIDADGDLDLIVKLEGTDGSSQIGGGQGNFHAIAVFENKDGAFTDVTQDWLFPYLWLIWEELSFRDLFVGDIDGNGYPDIFLNNFGQNMYGGHGSIVLEPLMLMNDGTSFATPEFESSIKLFVKSGPKDSSVSMHRCDASSCEILVTPSDQTLGRISLEVSDSQ